MIVLCNKWAKSVLVFLFLFCFVTSQAVGKEINVGFVNEMPPFVVGDSGILVDLVKEALSRSDYKIVNYKFPSKQFDKDPFSIFEDLDVFVGTPLSFRVDYSYGKIFDFDNVAISKKEKHLSIDTISDLKGKYIIGFNNANQHLKEPFTTFYKQYLENWEGYKELEDQSAQFQMLLKDHTQVILLDRSMAYYYARKAGIKNMESLVFHEIFPIKNTIYVIGRDQTYIGAITKNLKEMELDGTMLKILKKYR